jgi:hypothetical protein
MGSQPRVFQHSLDWRFLLPRVDVKKICLLAEEGVEFSQTLEQVGIHISQQLSLSDLKQNGMNKIQSFVMPFGVCAGWTGAKHEDQVAFYGTVRRLISSGGSLLIGFDNFWSMPARSKAKYYTSMPGRMAGQLKQAGFQSIKMFGAMPDLAVPEYVFDLDSRTIQFALRNRFRRKPALLHALRVVEGTLGWKRLSNFLPCYFVVATT